MVLRCSLLGHDFGEPEVEREREERGSEVVVSVQEYEECDRCGEKNVISENTEVTSLTAGTDADSFPDEPDTEPPEPPLESDATDGDPDANTAFVDADDTDFTEPVDGDDAELIDADDTEPDALETEPTANSEPEPTDTAADATDATNAAGPETDTGADDVDRPTDENGEPVTDDGEILEDDRSPDRDRDRDHGEWPDSNDVGPPVGAESTPSDWPDDADTDPDSAVDTDVEPDGPDPAAIDDDAVVLESDEPASGVGADGVGGGDGTTAAATDARSVTAEPPVENRDEPDADSTAEPETGIERAQSAPTPAESGGTASDDVPTEFYCPRCDYVAAGDRGSLRSGDICPDCRKGYLSERERR